MSGINYHRGRSKVKWTKGLLTFGRGGDGEWPTLRTATIRMIYEPNWNPMVIKSWSHYYAASACRGNVAGESDLHPFRSTLQLIKRRMYSRPILDYLQRFAVNSGWSGWVSHDDESWTNRRPNRHERCRLYEDNYSICCLCVARVRRKPWLAMGEKSWSALSHDCPTTVESSAFMFHSDMKYFSYFIIEKTVLHEINNRW